MVRQQDSPLWSSGSLNTSVEVVLKYVSAAGAVVER
jgi:hypothetical protein